MSATGADPRSERTPLRRESRTWGLIRRTLPRGRSLGSLFYLISVGLIASWIIAVFFGFGLFFLMPRSAKLAFGLIPGGTSFDARLPLTQQPTSRLDPLSDLPPPAPAHPMGDAATDKGRPAVAPPSPITAKVNPLPASAEKTIAHIIDEPPGKRLRWSSALSLRPRVKRPRRRRLQVGFPLRPNRGVRCNPPTLHHLASRSSDDPQMLEQHSRMPQ